MGIGAVRTKVLFLMILSRFYTQITRSGISYFSVSQAVFRSPPLGPFSGPFHLKPIPWLVKSPVFHTESTSFVQRLEVLFKYLTITGLFTSSERFAEGAAGLPDPTRGCCNILPPPTEEGTPRVPALLQLLLLCRALNCPTPRPC